MAGDGTTTAATLASTIYARCIERVPARYNSMENLGFQPAVDCIVEFLTENTKTITSTENRDERRYPRR